MAYSTIDKPNTQFTPTIYSGTSASHAVSVGFQPDLVWLKPRSVVDAHRLMNSVSGAGFYLMSNATNGESPSGTRFTSFDTDGFTLGDADEGWNQSGQTYVSWNWLGGGTASSNTDGSITSSVSGNTTAGFSIVSYTGTGATATVGHGLSQTPEMIIVKKRDSDGTDWITWGSVLGGTVGSEFIKLNSNIAKTTGLNSSWFNNTAPTSTVFTVGTQSDLNGSSSTYIGYCFNSVKGYSKIDSYVGNGSTNGTFVYTGFKPAFVLVKKSSGSASWMMYDNARDPDNLAGEYLYANESGAAQTASQGMDFLSNGIKMRNAFGDANESGQTYIYMAFAENPLVASNYVPTTAR